MSVHKTPLFRVVFGEVCTYDPVISKFTPLFYSQVALGVWNLTLIGVILANIASKSKFNWSVFGGIWIGVNSLIMILMWFFYRSWIDSCRTLPFPNQKQRQQTSLVIGKPMHSSISRATLASTGLYSLTLFIFTYVFALSSEFKGSIEHTIEITVLQALLTFSTLTVVAMIMSLATQFWPLANVQDVMVCIPTTRV